MRTRVAIIYILYNTDLKLLNESIKSLEESIPDNLDVSFFLYNNSHEDVIHSINIKEKFEYFHDGQNIGLAKAQNKIIKKNLNNFEYFLTSDQDSIYSPEYLEIGINFMEMYRHCGCVVPIWRNTMSQNLNFETQIILDNENLKKINPFDVEEDYFQVSHAICSGSIIRGDMFTKIGLFNEDFFIDWIDNEWMWRGHKAGLNVFCNKNLQIDHQWGEQSLKIMNIEFPNKSDLRTYYTVRNGIALVFQNGLESYFKKYLIIQLAKHLIYVFFSFNKNKYKNTIKAIFDFKKINLINVKR
tara:strand:+ start:2092 stop:2988 length:897 start_codon:yes stop_codon:yes gene_type:complete